AGGVEDDTAPVTSARSGSSRAWGWAGASVFLLVIVVLFDVYLHLWNTYMAAAVPYTAVIAIAMLLAKGRAHGPQAIMRMALVLAIMLAPQPGIGIFVLVFSVGHIGTAAPVMLTW